MQKHRSITEQRLDRFTSSSQFSDVNLYSILWKSEIPITEFSYFKTSERILFKDAITRTFTQSIDQNLLMTPSWSTYWFKVSFEIPQSYKGERVFFLFDPSCEALVYNLDGLPISGITGGKSHDRHIDLLLHSSSTGSESHSYYIEIALNGMFGNPGAEAGIITAPDPTRTFRLEKFAIAAINQPAQDLWHDFDIIRGMAKDLPSSTQLSADALYCANAIVNAVRPDVPETLHDGLRIAQEFFETRRDFGFADHVITAVGHCHIDSAWLWPYAETRRKCARSFATQCDLMDRYPDYKFSCSQAQQFEWVEQDYPLLFDRIKEKVKVGQFLPIGGTWVEMDCNVPSGEAFVRQFLYGQQYFEKTFGIRHKVFWLPDTFGYSSQLPQIMKQSDMDYFFTQKLSWNNINKFPNTTFRWVGSDGTSVLTHFCPADTYCAQVNVKEIAFSVTNNKDKEYSDCSLLLFGNGDGGGGPLAPMLERLKRLSCVAGLPAKVQPGDPTDFYKQLESQSRDLVQWKGELYFELHRGTYTTHAKVKMFNRMSEYILRSVEYLSSLCILQNVPKFSYPKSELDRLWKLVLLNQFHDVLPGSSIEMVYIDAWAYYEDVVSSATKLQNIAILALSVGIGFTCLNTTSWDLPPQVIAVEQSIAPLGQLIGDGSKRLVVLGKTEQFGASGFDESLQGAFESVTVCVDKVGGGFVLQNQYLIVGINEFGQVVSLIDRSSGRQVIAPGKCANVFKMYEDIPLYWDGWDVEIYHLEKGWNCNVGSVKVKESGALRVVLESTHPISVTSSLTQTITLTAVSKLVDFETRVEWNENRKILKVEFPVNIQNDYATYESAFGFERRPTHQNTSWDMAKFEVCGHKYVDFSEHGYGVALINDSKYGMAVNGNIIRLSLLRSPKAPDEHCDMHTHTFRYALFPHAGAFDEGSVVKTAYQYNVGPVVVAEKLQIPATLFSFDCDHVVLDTMKMAEDGSRAVILRLYESMGGRAMVKIRSSIDIKTVWQCNLLEDLGEKVEILGGVFEVDVSPFKIVTLKVSF